MLQQPSENLTGQIETYLVKAKKRNPENLSPDEVFLELERIEHHLGKIAASDKRADYQAQEQALNAQRYRLLIIRLMDCRDLVEDTTHTEHVMTEADLQGSINEIKSIIQLLDSLQQNSYIKTNHDLAQQYKEYSQLRAQSFLIIHDLQDSLRLQRNGPSQIPFDLTKVKRDKKSARVVDRQLKRHIRDTEVNTYVMREYYEVSKEYDTFIEESADMIQLDQTNMTTKGRFEHQCFLIDAMQYLDKRKEVEETLLAMASYFNIKNIERYQDDFQTFQINRNPVLDVDVLVKLEQQLLLMECLAQGEKYNGELSLGWDFNIVLSYIDRFNLTSDQRLIIDDIKLRYALIQTKPCGNMLHRILATHDDSDLGDMMFASNTYSPQVVQIARGLVAAIADTKNQKRSDIIARFSALNKAIDDMLLNERGEVHQEIADALRIAGHPPIDDVKMLDKLRDTILKRIQLDIDAAIDNTNYAKSSDRELNKGFYRTENQVFLCSKRYEIQSYCVKRHAVEEEVNQLSADIDSLVNTIKELQERRENISTDMDIRGLDNQIMMLQIDIESKLEQITRLSRLHQQFSQHIDQLAIMARVYQNSSNPPGSIEALSKFLPEYFSMHGGLNYHAELLKQSADEYQNNLERISSMRDEHQFEFTVGGSTPGIITFAEAKDHLFREAVVKATAIKALANGELIKWKGAEAVYRVDIDKVIESCAADPRYQHGQHAVHLNQLRLFQRNLSKIVPNPLARFILVSGRCAANLDQVKAKEVNALRQLFDGVDLDVSVLPKQELLQRFQTLLAATSDLNGKDISQIAKEHNALQALVEELYLNAENMLLTEDGELDPNLKATLEANGIEVNWVCENIHECQMALVSKFEEMIIQQLSGLRDAQQRGDLLKAVIKNKSPQSDAALTPRVRGCLFNRAMDQIHVELLEIDDLFTLQNYKISVEVKRQYAQLRMALFEGKKEREKTSHETHLELLFKNNEFMQLNDFKMFAANAKRPNQIALFSLRNTITNFAMLCEDDKCRGELRALMKHVEDEYSDVDAIKKIFTKLSEAPLTDSFAAYLKTLGINRDRVYAVMSISIETAGVDTLHDAITLFREASQQATQQQFQTAFASIVDIAKRNVPATSKINDSNIDSIGRLLEHHMRVISAAINDFNFIKSHGDELSAIGNHLLEQFKSLPSDDFEKLAQMIKMIEAMQTDANSYESYWNSVSMLMSINQVYAEEHHQPSIVYLKCLKDMFPYDQFRTLYELLDTIDPKLDPSQAIARLQTRMEKSATTLRALKLAIRGKARKREKYDLIDRIAEFDANKEKIEDLLLEIEHKYRVEQILEKYDLIIKFTNISDEHLPPELFFPAQQQALANRSLAELYELDRKLDVLIEQDRNILHYQHDLLYRQFSKIAESHPELRRLLQDCQLRLFPLRADQRFPNIIVPALQRQLKVHFQRYPKSELRNDPLIKGFLAIDLTSKQAYVAVRKLIRDVTGDKSIGIANDFLKIVNTSETQIPDFIAKLDNEDLDHLIQEISSEKLMVADSAMQALMIHQMIRALEGLRSLNETADPQQRLADIQTRVERVKALTTRGKPYANATINERCERGLQACSRVAKDIKVSEHPNQLGLSR